MALKLQGTTQLNVSVVVNNAINAVREIRSNENSRKEAEFQRAVADGLSYEGQIEYRKKQLEEEAQSSFSDQEYKTRLEDSIATTKRLKRFYDYRQKYQQSLAELNAGHTNAVEHAELLKSLLANANDPDLAAEIQTNITNAETKVTNYRNTVLSNQVKLAQFDGTEKVINEVLEKVKKAKSLAAINGNEDEVEQYNLTIAALNSQKVQTKAENTVNDIAVAGMLGTSNSKSKLKTLNDQVYGADETSPVTINGKQFASEKQYWEITRNAYLSGNGSGVFADYFNDLETQYKQTIDGETARFGFVQPSTIQSINSDLTNLRSQPEMSPFLDRIDSFRSIVVADAVSTVAKTVIDRASYTGDFTQADTTLKGLESTYKVDTKGFQLQLGNILNQRVNASIEAGLGVPKEAALLPASEFAIPTVPTPTTPTTPVTPTQPAPVQPTFTPSTPAQPTAPKSNSDYSVVAGDNLSKIAARNGMSLNQLLELNPSYKANPNSLAVGANLKLSSGTQTPTQPTVSVPTTPAAPAVNNQNPQSTSDKIKNVQLNTQQGTNDINNKKT